MRVESNQPAIAAAGSGQTQDYGFPTPKWRNRARVPDWRRGRSTAPQTGAPDAQLMNAVSGSMMIEKMLDDEFRAHHVQPTDAQIQKYYEEHRDLFVKDPGEVELAHIAVKLPPNATDAQKKAAAEKIIKIYNEAKTTKDFAALAKQNSEDTGVGGKGWRPRLLSARSTAAGGGQGSVRDAGRAVDANRRVEPRL